MNNEEQLKPTPTGPTSPSGPSVNRTPVAADGTLGVVEDTPATVQLAASDADGDVLTYAIVTAAQHGSVTVTTTGEVTYTPAAEFSGSDVFTFKVNDGLVDSNVATITVIVVAAEDVIAITEQPILVTPEDTAITLNLSAFTVTDIDGVYPGSFQLVVGDGANYTHSGLTITPNLNFNGTLTVPVSLTDGVRVSPSYSATISVVAVNDAPVITGQRALTTIGSTPIVLSLVTDDVTFTDIDTVSGFSLNVLAGTGYQVNGSEVTPDLGATGSITVPVQVFDGQTSSVEFPVTINIINNPPTLTGQLNTPTLDEETFYDIAITDLDYEDTDTAAQDMRVIVLADDPVNSPNLPASPTTPGGPSAPFYTLDVNNPQRFIPKTNFFGTLKVTVAITDGFTQTAPIVIDATVNNLNDPPTLVSALVSQQPYDTPFSLALDANWVITDPDNDVVTAIVVADGTGYSATGTDAVVDPDTGVVGDITLSVRVFDPSGLPSLPLDVPVTIFNTAPTASQPAGAPAEITVDEESTYSFVLPMPGQLDTLDPDTTQNLAVVVEAGPDYSLGTNANQFTPNEDVTGPITVNLRVFDGFDSSSLVAFRVNVTNLNDIPAISVPVGRIAPTLPIGATFIIETTDVTLDDPDTGDTHTIAAVAGANYTFTNNLSDTEIVLDAGYVGPVLVKVVVQDAALATSNEIELEFNAGNSTPTIARLAPGSETHMSEGTTRLLALTDIAPGPYDADVGQSYRLEAVDNGANTYTISGANSQSITPTDLNFSGNLTVRVWLWDGVIHSNELDITIVVDAVNDAPVITSIVNKSAHIGTTVSFALATDIVANDTADTPPGTLTLTLDVPGGGDHYTRPTTTSILLEPGYFSLTPLVIPFVVTDGQGGSTAGTISVTLLNDAPVISANGTPNMDEGAAYTFVLATDVSVNPGNDVGQTYALNVLDDLGTTYTHIGNTVEQVDKDSNTTLQVRVQVSEVGTTAVSNVLTLPLTIDPVNDAPIAVYETGPAMTANQQISQPAGTLTAGATDAENDTITTVAATDAPTIPAGGAVQIASDGSYTVAPPPGFTNGNLTFQYQLSDNGTPSPAISAPRTVTLAVSGTVVWYVNNSSVATVANGVRETPFKTLPAAETPSLAGQTISVATTGTDYAVAGNFTLDANQTLLGTGGTPRLAIAGANGFVTGAGSTIISGVDIVGTTRGITSATASASLTLADSTVSGGNHALHATNFDQLQLTRVSASATANSTILASAGTKLTITSSTLTNVGVGAALTASSCAVDVVAADGGAVPPITASTASTQGGRILDWSSVVAGATFGQLTSTSTAGAPGGGIALAAVSGTLTMPGFTVGGAVAVSSMIPLHVSGASSVVANLGNISLRSTSNQDVIRMESGGTAAVTATATAPMSATNGRVLAVSSGTLSLSGAVAMTSTNASVVEVVNPGRLPIKLGALTSTGSSQYGIQLNNPATTIAVTSATVSGKTLSAVNVANASNSVTLDTLAVSASVSALTVGGGSGVVTVGLPAALAPNGGLWDNLSGNALVLNSAAVVTLNGVRMTNVLGNGVHGAGAPQNVNLNDIDIVNAGDTAAEAGIVLGVGGTAVNPLNSFIVNNGRIVSNSGRNLIMATTTSSSGTVRINGTSMEQGTGGAGLVARATNSSSLGDVHLPIEVTNTRFSRSAATLLTPGSSIDLGTLGTLNAASQARITATITNNKFVQATNQGDDAITIFHEGAGTSTLTATGNVINGYQRGITAIGRMGLLVSTIDNNDIGTDEATGQDKDGDGFTGETQPRTSRSGVYTLVDPRLTTIAAKGDFTVTNNMVRLDDAGAQEGVGMTVAVRGGDDVERAKVRASISGNTLNSVAGNDAFRLYGFDIGTLCATVSGNSGVGNTASFFYNAYLDRDAGVLFRLNSAQPSADLVLFNENSFGSVGDQYLALGITTSAVACPAP